MNNDKTQLSNLIDLNDEQRAQYLIKTVCKENQLWVLKDQDGCVILNSEDEDCIPLWPDQSSALLWATKEWQHCEAQSISLTEWFERWSSGLVKDNLGLVLFPSEFPQGEGIVYFPEEFEQALLIEQRKHR